MSPSQWQMDCCSVAAGPPSGCAVTEQRANISQVKAGRRHSSQQSPSSENACIAIYRYQVVAWLEVGLSISALLFSGLSLGSQHRQFSSRLKEILLIINQSIWYIIDKYGQLFLRSSKYQQITYWKFRYSILEHERTKWANQLLA